MALRLLQIFVPEDANVEELLDDREVLGTWRDATVNDRVVLHLLVPVEETEPVMDRFEEAFGNADGFRVILTRVDAVLPRPEEPSENADSETDDDEQSHDVINESGRVSREELYSDITETLGINRVFLAMTVLSSVVAAVGLLRNDVAVIIGAMVIAPLLGPNVAMSLATTLGDVALLRQALFTNVIGISLSLAVSLVIGVCLPIDETIPAIAQRTEFSLGDIALALAAGSAGTFAFTRGLSNAVIGVMVAVALMPPLVTFGMLLGNGQIHTAWGAMLLVMGNVVCINLAGVGTFLTQGVRPRSWWEEERAKKSTRIAIATWLVLLLALGLIVVLISSDAS